MTGKTMEIPKATNLNNDIMKEDICKLINAMKDERTEQNNTMEDAIHRENNVRDYMNLGTNDHDDTYNMNLR